VETEHDERRRPRWLGNEESPNVASEVEDLCSQCRSLLDHGHYADPVRIQKQLALQPDEPKGRCLLSSTGNVAFASFASAEHGSTSLPNGLSANGNGIQLPYGNPEGMSFRQVANAFSNAGELWSMLDGTAMWTLPPVKVGSGT
jgi:hypothetical protein